MGRLARFCLEFRRSIVYVASVFLDSNGLTFSQVNFVIVSLIFVFACVVCILGIFLIYRLIFLQGFIAGALMNIHLMDRYGFGKARNR